MRRYLISLLLLLPGSAMAACPALLDRSMNTILEKPQSLCEYAGKVVLVVNTASQCGYTPQYDGLEALYKALAQETGQRPKWNFHKYLVDRSGKRVQSFDTRVAPQDPKLVSAIEKLLEEK